MAQQMNQCERMGVNPRWPSYKSVLGRIATVPDHEEFYRNAIREYTNREDASPTQLVPNKSNITRGTSEWLAIFQANRVLATAKDNTQWIKQLTYWTRYYQVGVGQSYFWSEQLNKRPTPDGKVRQHSFSTQDAANMMATMAMLGWKEAVIYQGYLTFAALNRGHQLVVERIEQHRRAQAFMLRLFADWVGDVSHQWPGYAYDEPIYEALLAHWRTPNPDDLVPCLLAACDRHTWQTGKESQKNSYDFNQDRHLECVPVEILFIFRLRQWEGLANPSLDHPLMAAPFDQLPPEQPVPELDELMQGVLKRALEDWPQYDEVLSLESLKK